jgi:uncharacterized protein
MYDIFGLTLVLNHTCNLRCSYCYTGAKSDRRMTFATAQHALRRALQSLTPKGTLELSFFGGEPLLEAELLAEVLQAARQESRQRKIQLITSLTTNGTQTEGLAWQLLSDPELDLSVSFDGLPSAHDLHRRFADDRPSSQIVLETIHRLVASGRDFQVVMVVGPDTVDHLGDGLRFLRDQGVRMVAPTLDLWAFWKPVDLDRLAAALVGAARLWHRSLPNFGVSWFNEKLVNLAKVPVNRTARCGFGEGEVAVTPSGNLYPCERLIGEDREDNPMRLPGHVMDGEDFLSLSRPHEPDQMEACGLSCRCANYVRTGCTGQPDALIRRLDEVCEREVRRRLLRCEKRPARAPQTVDPGG